MKKVLLFPLDENVEWLVQNKTSSSKYRIQAVSSYEADKEKLKLLQSMTTVYCNEDFEKCVKKVDCVIFGENTEGYNYEGYKKRIKIALDYKREIYIKTIDFQKLEIRNDALIHQIQDNEVPKFDDKGKLKDIPIPIIAILGMGEHCGKFILQNKMKNVIENKGYKVLAITAGLLGLFNDMEVLPGFVFSDQISLPRKVKLLNAWIYNLYKNGDYDVILLMYPSGILWIDEYEPNYFNEIPIVISNSVIADDGVLAVYKYFDQYQDSMKDLDMLCEKKYNLPIKYFVGSEWFYRVHYEKKEIEYFRDGKEDLNDNKQEGYCYMSIKDDKKIEQMANGILLNLENNICVI